LPEPLLAILKLCALALLYLFFFRVLRAVWAEVNAPKLVAAGAGGAGGAVAGRGGARRRAVDGLVIMEPAQLRGRTYELGEETTMGRSSACQATLEDGYASQVHARVFRTDSGFVLEDLGSTNGTLLNNRPVTAPVPLKKGDRIKIGSTVLEVSG
jgi:hypothetical protein